MAGASERDFAPLSSATVRGLNDKLYEKRKVAALDVEKLVRDYAVTNNSAQIRKLLQVLGHDFTLSQNANSRKGGLIGLAATSIALGKDSTLYVHELVKPVLTCFFDADSRVRYYGCESLYNIVKVARGAVLPYFNDIFDGLSKLAADPDQNVRSGSELLDRLMKDIVAESCQFDLVAFVPLLRERIYTKNAFSRQFLVSWISALDAVPDIDMLVFLPEILDGLLTILGEPNSEIRKMCEACLGEFLQGIRKRSEKANFSAMVNILICHSQSADPVIQYTSLVWLHEFLQLSRTHLLPFTSGILASVLPCYSYDDDFRRKTIEAARNVNSNLMKLIASKSTGETESEDNPEILAADIGKIVEVLSKQLVHNSMQTRVATLRWVFHLFQHTPHNVFQHVDELFPLMLKTLSDPSDEVVLLDLEVLAELSSSSAGKQHPPIREDSISDSLQTMLDHNPALNAYFVEFMYSLLQLFSTDRQLLEERGSFIIRQLCIQLNAEDIYRCCAEIMLKEDDAKFASCMIQTLSTILLTSTELFPLRTQLKELSSEETCTLFVCLYKSWCHNPVSTVALCFLTQNYQHAADLISVFGDLEVTVDLLTQVDKLVQLIESPIFTYLRLQLLEGEESQALVKSLYGLLMLLPQSDAFRTLQRRLDCIPKLPLPPAQHSNRVKSSTENRVHVRKIHFKELLQHFLDVQRNHQKSQSVLHKSKLSSQKQLR